MKKIQLKLNPAMMKGLIDCIGNLFIEVQPVDDEGKLLFAVLQELHLKLAGMDLRHQAKYTIQLTPTQAIALKLMQINFVQDVTTHVGNKLHAVVQDVNKLYQTPKRKPLITT